MFNGKHWGEQADRERRLSPRALEWTPVRHPLDDVLVAALAPANVYAVGGRVRDEFRARLDGVERPPKDLDYVVTGLSQADLLEKLQAVGRVDVVGASFAVLKFRHAAGQADIALPRRERSTGVGHKAFDVEAGPDVPLEDDLRPPRFPHEHDRPAPRR